MWKFGLLFFLYLFHGVQALEDWSPGQNEHEKASPKQPEVNQLSILPRNKTIIDFGGLLNRNISSTRGKSLRGTAYPSQSNSSTKWRFANIRPSKFHPDPTEESNWNSKSTVSNDEHLVSTESPVFQTATATRTGNYKWQGNKRDWGISETSSAKPTTVTFSPSTYRWVYRRRLLPIRKDEYTTSSERTSDPTSATTSTISYRWQDSTSHMPNRKDIYSSTSISSTSSYEWPDSRSRLPDRRNKHSTTFDTIQTSSIAHSDLSTSTTSTNSVWNTTSLAPETTERGWYHPIMWDNWSFWSPCTRTCGQGVKVRTRQCLVWDGKKFSRTHITGCNGADIRYKVCHRRKCSRLGEDYRSQQCDLLNRKPFLTTKYSKWLPSYSQDRPCYLRCRPETGSRSFNFGYVQDGTKCYKTGSSVCITGKCKKVGCDGVVESTVLPDMCGICNGKNSTCYRVSRTVLSEFPRPDSKFPDYTRIATIPRGSRYLKVLDYSRNNLALMNQDNQFIINGDRLVQDGGEYKMAGTTVTYIRSGTLGEIIMADGPITENITIMLLYRQKNHEIKYEYWEPKINGKHRDVPYDTSHNTRSKTVGDLTDDTQWRKIMSGDSKSKNKDDIFLRTKWRLNERISSNNDVLYSSDNQRKSKKLKRRPLQRQKLKFKKKNCPKCWKVKDKKKQFCQSDFVSRILVKSATIQNGETRYDVTVIKNYKNGRANLLGREFLWVPNICKCPKLKVGKEFIVMGKLASVRHSELRLSLTEKNYVRKFKPQYEPKLHRLRRKLSCK